MSEADGVAIHGPITAMQDAIIRRLYPTVYRERSTYWRLAK